jgi:hypothetical protein
MFGGNPLGGNIFGQYLPPGMMWFMNQMQRPIVQGNPIEDMLHYKGPFGTIGAPVWQTMQRPGGGGGGGGGKGGKGGKGAKGGGKTSGKGGKGDAPPGRPPPPTKEAADKSFDDYYKTLQGLGKTLQGLNGGGYKSGEPPFQPPPKVGPQSFHDQLNAQLGNITVADPAPPPPAHMMGTPPTTQNWSAYGSAYDPETGWGQQRFRSPSWTGWLD